MPARRPDELTSRTPLSTDWMMITPTDGPTFKCAVSAIASSGVTSLNQLVGATAGALLTGAVVLKQGTNVTLSTDATTKEITINSTAAAASGITSLSQFAGTAFTGAAVLKAGTNVTMSTTGTEITINSTATAASGVTALNSLTGAVVLAAGTNVTLSTDAATKAITINATAASGVTSLNSLTGGLNIVAGANITVTPSGTDITIDGAAGAGGAQTVNNQTGTYTFVIEDAQALVTMNSVATAGYIVPTNANVAFPIGTGIDILALSSTGVQVSGQAGVTLNATPGKWLRSQFSGGTLLKIDTNTWVLVGDTKV